MIGCASHRFNLGMKEFYSIYENDLSDANEIMKKLSNLKNAGVLRNMTPLRPIIRNTTRWSSRRLVFKESSRVAEKAHGGVGVDGRGTRADTWGFTQHWPWMAWYFHLQNFDSFV